MRVLKSVAMIIGSVLTVFAAVLTLMELLFNSDGYEWHQMEYNDKYGSI